MIWLRRLHYLAHAFLGDSPRSLCGQLPRSVCEPAGPNWERCLLCRRAVDRKGLR